MDARFEIIDRLKRDSLADVDARTLDIFIEPDAYPQDGSNAEKASLVLQLLQQFRDEKHSKRCWQIQGDSGAGKTLFGQWLATDLWTNQNEWISIFIHLPAYPIKKRYFEKYLRKQCDFIHYDIEQ